MDVTLPFSDAWNDKRIGLLGGSFNPAHDGHLEMSLFALKRLKLDAVWWLVSPGNPLKKNQEMQAFSARLEGAKREAEKQKDVFVTDIETQLGTCFTIDTLRALKTQLPSAHFVWLMGADNFQTFHLWRDWEAIMHTLPIAVFKRSGYLDSGKRCEAAARYAGAEMSLAAAEDLAVSKPPFWVVLDNKPNPLSATQIRQQSQPT